eukprot:6479197-Amphidinium_carterae.1
MECVDRFAALDHENNDDEEFISAESDVEPSSTANREGKQCSTGVTEAFLVYQNSFRRALQAWSYQTKLWPKHVQRAWFLSTLQRLLNRQSGGTRVAHPADRTVLFIRELQAPILDDKTWLSDMRTSETDAKGGTLGNTKVEALGEDGETAPLSTDRLQEGLSSSDDDSFS